MTQVSENAILQFYGEISLTLCGIACFDIQACRSFQVINSSCVFGVNDMTNFQVQNIVSPTENLSQKVI